MRADENLCPVFIQQRIIKGAEEPQCFVERKLIHTALTEMLFKRISSIAIGLAAIPVSLSLQMQSVLAGEGTSDLKIAFSEVKLDKPSTIASVRINTSDDTPQIVDQNIQVFKFWQGGTFGQFSIQFYEPGTGGSGLSAFPTQIPIYQGIKQIQAISRPGSDCAPADTALFTLKLGQKRNLVLITSERHEPNGSSHVASNPAQQAINVYRLQHDESLDGSPDRPDFFFSFVARQVTPKSFCDSASIRPAMIDFAKKYTRELLENYTPNP